TISGGCGCFTKVNQTGGSTYPAQDTYEDREISLDIEWAHAIAPGAHILLVEANSAYWPDTLTAIDYATSHAHVVSLSFSSSETALGSENEHSYDSHLDKPVAITAAAGDTGTPAVYPSASPYVLSVGGTSLTIGETLPGGGCKSGGCTHEDESVWNNSRGKGGGGVSQYEAEPPYQYGYCGSSGVANVNKCVNSSGKLARGTPDVSWVGDPSPSSGVAVYNSVGYGGYQDWVVEGGTSLGAPSYAGLIARADQHYGRVLTTNSLTSRFTYQDDATVSDYASDYHDITKGTNGSPCCIAGTGYDLASGLGSPNGKNWLTYTHSLKVVFTGYDANGLQQLWLTDSTTNGTKELAPIAGANTTYGLEPGYLYSLGSKAVFSGLDAKNHYQVWATDGTIAGTTELTTETNTAGSGSGGVDPLYFTVLGNRAVFSGWDSQGNNGLWATDGTPGGTYELTTGNIVPSVLTRFNNLVFFYGNGSASPSGSYGLWRTDGTKAGTFPLPNSPISLTDFTVFGNEALFTQEVFITFGDEGVWITDGTTAGTHVVQDVTQPGFARGPSGYAVVGNRAFFDAFDANDLEELWITDGTAGGTQELTTSTGGPVGLGVVPRGITALGAHAVFAGIDANGVTGLWVSNGTPSGTYEVTTQCQAPYAFTPLGGQLLFSAYPYSAARSLWITNGTRTGTVQLGPTGLQPQYISVFGSIALFNGTGTDGNQLWRTNGTPSGTVEVKGGSAYQISPLSFALIN
ncbi:MAG TPA: hypothetical protein VKQ36_16430, partial [Ktedonobacterales bacterium]|nr:hypothetical protein [Ktedonobacterales bacterium]